MSRTLTSVSLEGVKDAARRLEGIAVRTPLERSRILSERYGAEVWLKREDLQVVRSYKLRGAYNKISSLPHAQLKRGVVCASAGNHAQGFAYACNALGIPGAIYMPSTTPKQKVRMVEYFGNGHVDVVLVGDTFDQSQAQAVAFAEANERTIIPPFDDPMIIEGQGTVGLEIMEDLPEGVQPDYVFVPIGGGGLSSGLSVVFDELLPDVKLVGVEPEGAPAMYESMRAGHVVTLPKINRFVDGAAVQRVGDLNFSILSQRLDQVVLVPEGKVCSTIIGLYNEVAIVVEPAGALSIAALDSMADQIKGKTVLCVVSGSNNDLGRMQEIKERSQLFEGLKHYFIIRFPQRAGALREFLDNVLGPNDDITRFEYVKKNARESGPALVGIELKRPGDYGALLERMTGQGINYTTINEDPNLFEYFL